MRGVVTLPSKTSQVRVWLRSSRSRSGPLACRMTLATSSLASISVLVARSSSCHAASCSRTSRRAALAASGSSGSDQVAMASGAVA